MPVFPLFAILGGTMPVLPLGGTMPVLPFGGTTPVLVAPGAVLGLLVGIEAEFGTVASGGAPLGTVWFTRVPDGGGVLFTGKGRLASVTLLGGN